MYSNIIQDFIFLWKLFFPIQTPVRSDWLKSENVINIMMKWVITSQWNGGRGYL